MADTTTLSLLPPPVAPGVSRVSQVEWYGQQHISPGRSLLAVYGDIYGVSPEVALRIMGGLSGGLGHTGETCGTVIAAIMLLSLKHESSDINDRDAHTRMVALAKQFTDDFRAKYNTVVCRELIQCDISTPELYAAARENPHAFDQCFQGGKAVAELLETKYDILNRKRENT